MEKLFAVGAALVAESLSVRKERRVSRTNATMRMAAQWPSGERFANAKGHDDRADHAGTQVALVTRRDEVVRRRHDAQSVVKLS